MILTPDDPHQFEFSSRSDIINDEPLVGLIDKIVDKLDLNELYGRYSESGRSFYDPSMQLKVLFFSYCDGVRSSRDIARHIRYDLRYRYFCGSLRPDFRTINRFRKDNLDLLEEYFTHIVLLCEESDLLDMSVLSLDGTKIKADSSGKGDKRSRLKRLLRENLQADIDADCSDSSDDDNEPDKSGRYTGNSDPDARYMKNSDGGKRLSYNSQIVVDKNQFIILAEVGNNADDSVYLEGLLQKSKELYGDRIGSVAADGGYCTGRNIKYAADGGIDLYLPLGKGDGRVPDKSFNRHEFSYCSDRDIYICPEGKELHYAGERVRHGKTIRNYSSSSLVCGYCPKRLLCTKQRYRKLSISEYYGYEQDMKRKNASYTGRLMSIWRRCLVEPVFGDIKTNLGFKRFSLRTLPKARGEFYLACIAHNLKKLLKLRPESPSLANFETKIGDLIIRMKILVLYRIYPTSKPAQYLKI